MTWITQMFENAREQLSSLLPDTNPVDMAKDFVVEAVAQRIREEASAKAKSLLAKAHRSVLRTICIQNGALLLSIALVYLYHSPIPFYLAYVAVSLHSAYNVWTSLPLVSKMVLTWSITQTISGEVHSAINAELMQRQLYERKAMEWLGPDLRKIADEVARKLRPDVLAAFTSMAITLLASIIMFRLYMLPYLEQRALM